MSTKIGIGILVGCLATTSCHVMHSSSSVVVDGVKLEQEHTEFLEVQDWDIDGLVIEAHAGDIRIEPTSGPNSIECQLFEATFEDAFARYENGRLIARTRSGEPAAFGDVTVRVNGKLPSLRVETGMGDIEVRGVPISGRAELSSGMGDIDAEGIGLAESVRCSSGMGDVTIKVADADRISASSGMGDVSVKDCIAQEAEFSSGMGDVSVVRGDFDRLEASTGFGDVSCQDTRYERGDLDTGLGSVHKD